MVIRRATKDDATGIAEVHIRSWQETYKGIVSQDYLDSLKAEDRKPLWEKSLSESPDKAPVYVAVNPDGEIIGFASYGKERTGKVNAYGELYAIYILQKGQKAKNGLKLIKAGVEELLKQKYKSMLVWVLSDNGSRGFYESLKPQKAGEEVVEIAGEEYVEFAYVWHDLESLLELVRQKL
ncbi:GNAT family N-acetyltransferase [Mesobacillus subterraneus]|uniref:GNAT family N-acetyltransferase n=1 Tax=Mesobacillus subterraneus TaxID=285983 RepID=A0A3R9E2Q4_9BACI|nr:GNAT family N-acetyltransferase [Mesobacillus subterraneus]RSD24836.1 GNAT family N-acetyltransferase [Mesobacillus subterraneus]